MKKIKKWDRWGFELKCSCCQKTSLFRTKRQLDKQQLHFCRPCAALKASYIARGVNTWKFQNSNFFNSPDLKSFYWAGFIAADGYIETKKNQVTLKLSEKDVCQLKQFIKDVGSNARVLNSGLENRKRVIITDEHWIYNLANTFNIHQAKSLNHLPPQDSFWTDDQKKAFIIGYLDGDGTICFCGKQKYLKLGFIGTKEFLTWIKNFLVHYYQISLKSTCIQHKKKCVGKNVYELTIYCSKAQKVLQDLKQLPIYKLERKWERVC